MKDEENEERWYTDCHTNLRQLRPFLQPTSRKFRDYMYCRQTRNIQPVLFQTVNQDVYKGVLEHLRESTYIVAPNHRQQGSVPATGQRVATYSIIHQRIFISTSNHCIAASTVFSRFVTLQVFLIPMTKTSTGKASIQ